MAEFNESRAQFFEKHADALATCIFKQSLLGFSGTTNRRQVLGKPEMGKYMSKAMPHKAVSYFTVTFDMAIFRQIITRFPVIYIMLEKKWYCQENRLI